MRTTIEMKDEHRARLLEIAARRREKGFSGLVAEAIELYLAHQASDDAERAAALGVRGALSEEEAAALRAEARALREAWR